MGHKKRGKSAKRARAAQIAQGEPDLVKKAPHSFIFHKGSVGKHCLELVRDLRKVMEPYTATNLKAQRKNHLRDFVSIAGPLGVTHMIIISRTNEHVNLRIIRTPRGPTLTFRVKAYSLSRDVISQLKRPLVYEQQFTHHPLLVQSNLKQEKDGCKQLTLVHDMLQNMFPALNINYLDLNSVRRCALFHYDNEKDTITFRHYTIKAVPSGVSKSAKKLVQSKLPDLSKYKDISDYFTNPGQLSESEYELEPGASEVTLPQDLTTRGCQKKSTVNVRLIELGPRLHLQLIKIESGMNTGEVLYHKYVTKTAKEKKVLVNKRMKIKKLKQDRKKVQEKNIEKKKVAKEKHKVKCIEGMQGLEDNEIKPDPVKTEGEITEKSVKKSAKRKHKEVCVDTSTNDESGAQSSPVPVKKKKKKKLMNGTAT